MHPQSKSGTEDPRPTSSALKSEMSNVKVLPQEAAIESPSLPAESRDLAWERAFEPVGAGASSRTALGKVLAVADVIAIVVSLALTVGAMLLLGRDVSTPRLATTLLLMFPAWFTIAYLSGLYSLAELRISHGLVDEVGKVIIAVTAWSWLLLVVRDLAGAAPVHMAGPFLLWAIAVPVVLSGRVLSRVVARRKSRWRTPVAVIGSEDDREEICERIRRHPEWGLDVKAELDLEKDGADSSAVWRNLEVGRVILAGGPRGLADRTSLVNSLVEQGLMVDVVSGGPESIYSNALLHDAEGLPVLSVRPTRLRPMDLRAKRIFDLVAASLGLLLAAPVLLWAAVRIKLDSQGPVFFRQPRCGRDGEEIQVLKLRTMVDGADDLRDELRLKSSEAGEGEVLFKMEDDPRVTEIGQTLRKWSIDELPQLWNVIRGEMSMVGPRPLPFDEAVQATGVYWARTRVKPGLAGPWQAYGRSTIPFEDMIRLDYSYALGWSMAEDARLMLRTASAVFSRRGAY